MTIRDQYERSRRRAFRFGLGARENVTSWSDTVRERLRSRGGFDLRTAPFQKSVKIAFWCALFLGFSIAGLAADNPLALWANWLPLLFLLICAVVGALDPGAFYSVGGLVAGLTVGLAALGTRVWVALAGPVPHASIQELVTLQTGLFIAATMWLLGRRRPYLVLTAWVAAMAVIITGRVFPLAEAAVFRSDLLPAALSLVWGLIALSGALAAPMPIPTTPEAAEALAPEKTERRNLLGLAYFTHLLAWGAGGALAKLCLTYAARVPRGAPDAIDRGAMALQWMWTKSALFGWNRGPLQKLSGAVMEPLETQFADWMGWFGFMGAYGIVTAFFFGFIALGALAVAHRRTDREGFSRGNIPHLSLLAAQAMLVWIALGAPSSELPFLLLCGWLGLGMTSGYHRPDRRPLAQALRYSVAIPSLAALLALTVISLGPIWARAYVGGIRHDDLVDPASATRLARALRFARLVSPYDPKVDWADGLRLRNELQRELSQGWNETLFQRAVDAYRRAARLDPYDAVYALELAYLYKVAERPAEANKVIEGALAYTPRSKPLIEWLYLYADQRQDTKTAMEMIERALKVDPASPEWWKRRYDYARRVGQGPQAGYALSVALMANPGDTALSRSALQRHEMISQAPAGENPDKKDGPAKN